VTAARNPSFRLSRLPLLAWVLTALAVVVILPAPALAQVRNDIVPDAWQGDALRPKPDMRGLEKLRFVTDSDYPPFHYLDEVGALTGFNVDLAKAICETLEVQCEVKDVDWSDIFTTLDRGEADAAIASIRISAESLEKADFTSRYYATPARFVALKTNALKDIRPETLEGMKVGVAKGTGHEAYLKLSFPDVAIASFDTPEDATKALKNGAIDFVFGDGIGIAVKKGNRHLAEILNYGLEQVHASGRYEELFLRYFPMSFF
jgi:polar amino acid transport system substrate-binding protein